MFLKTAIKITLVALGFAACTSADLGDYIVVSRVGDGSVALSSNTAPIFMDIYATNGTLISSKSTGIFASGSATSEGRISISVDGNYVVAGGVDSTIAGIATTSKPRAVVRLDSTGTVSRATTFSDAYQLSSSLRSVYSVDGSVFYVSGSSQGVRLTNLNGTTTSDVWTGNGRSIGIFGGVLYVSSASSSPGFKGVAAFSGLPTSTTTPTLVLGSETSSPYDFIIFSTLNVAFVADDATGYGLTRYDLVGGVWTKTYILSDPCRGLTGYVSGNNFVLFVSTTVNTIVRVVEPVTAAVGVHINTIVVNTAGTNTAFRGVALAPKNFLSAPTTTTSSSSSVSSATSTSLSSTSSVDTATTSTLTSVASTITSSSSITSQSITSDSASSTSATTWSTDSSTITSSSSSVPTTTSNSVTSSSSVPTTTSDSITSSSSVQTTESTTSSSSTTTSPTSISTTSTSTVSSSSTSSTSSSATPTSTCPALSISQIQGSSWKSKVSG
ncbi:hypothetical protein HDU76_009943, partial [Blyttiomyces sp. JEL0837]